jgi:YHS domain-containing protein
VRLLVDNPDFILKPDMFVDVELTVSLPAAITVPADAVLDTGIKKIVYVDLGNGYFEPRQVDTGWRFGRLIEVIGGLMVGEKVVVSGNFLIDSESHLRTTAAGTRGNRKKDLVCGMYVDKQKAEAEGWTVQYEGDTYLFCSDQCKESFEKDPNQYLGKTANAGAFGGQSIDPVGFAKDGDGRTRDAENIDPKCSMADVAEEAKAAGRTREYEGRIYYFCSDQCKKDFDNNFEKYFEQKTDKHSHGSNPDVSAGEKRGLMKGMEETGQVVDRAIAPTSDARATGRRS